MNLDNRVTAFLFLSLESCLQIVFMLDGMFVFDLLIMQVRAPLRSMGLWSLVNFVWLEASLGRRIVFHLIIIMNVDMIARLWIFTRREVPCVN